MTIEEYLKRADEIREQEFMSYAELAKVIGITYLTLRRIRNNPELCRMRTAKKIKAFVDSWNVKNYPIA